MHVRLEGCDNKFAPIPQYVLDPLDWIERNSVASSVDFAEKKTASKWYQLKSNSQIVNLKNVKRMISDD